MSQGSYWRARSEPGARNQYQATIQALLGKEAATALLARESRTFPGRLGIQHRDVPYAVLSDIADGGIIFSHLAAFYARSFRIACVRWPVPAANRSARRSR